MPTHKLTPEIINAAVEGFEQQKLRIDAQIAELRAMLTGTPTEPAAAPESLKAASSAESVWRFWFRESSQVVIKGNFHSLVGTKAVGSSGNHSDFVVETLNGAIDRKSTRLNSSHANISYANIS